MRRPHDPERAAAAYVTGEQRARARRRFEEHLVSCEDCWHEVQLGREGRRVAESVRELAPADLREDVRAAVALMGGAMPRPRRARIAWRIGVALSAFLLATVAALSIRVLRPHEPSPIAAATAAYRTGLRVHDVTSTPGPDLSAEGWSLAASGRSELGGMVVDAFMYRSENGGHVLLFLSGQPFPVADGAVQRTSGPHGWTASVDGISLACGDDSESYLLVGADPHTLARVESGLHGHVGAVTG
jgi:hypothetical protein